MKNIFLLITLSLSLIACDKLDKADKSMDAVQKMNKKMDDMNGNMTEMKRKMSLGVSFQNYAEQQNYDIVDPIPLKLTPWAQTVADNVTVLELVQYAQGEFLLINNGKTLKTVNETGERVPFTMQEKAKLNDQKKLRVGFLEMIAGLLPASTTEGLIVEARVGAYAPTARKLLMLRYAFIKDFQFGTAKMDETFLNVAMAQSAFDELDKADYLARRDTNNDFVFETSGLKKLSDDEEDPNYHWHIDRDDLKSAWSTLLNRLDSDMQSEVGTSVGSNQSVHSAEKIQSLKSQIQTRLEYWNKNQTQP